MEMSVMDVGRVWVGVLGCLVFVGMRMCLAKQDIWIVDVSMVSIIMRVPVVM